MNKLPFNKNFEGAILSKYPHAPQPEFNERFDYPHLVSLMNNLYANEFSLRTNFFTPALRLSGKTRIGARVVKKHGKPQTLAWRPPGVTKQQKKNLWQLQNSLNPCELRDTL